MSKNTGTTVKNTFVIKAHEPETDDNQFNEHVTEEITPKERVVIEFGKLKVGGWLEVPVPADTTRPRFSKVVKSALTKAKHDEEHRLISDSEKDEGVIIVKKLK